MSQPAFDGSDYDHRVDAPRLARQHEVIRDLMADGRWRTLSEIAQATCYHEASISAQLRHLRKERFGSYRVEKRHRGDRARGLYEYRLLPPLPKGQLSLIASALLLVAIAAPGTAQADRSVGATLALYGAAIGADVASTEYALARGAREANPLLRDRGRLYAAKVGQLAALAAIDLHLQRAAPRNARWFRRAVVLGHIGLAAWNVRQARRAK